MFRRTKTFIGLAILALTAGYAVHLGGCDVNEATKYTKNVCERTKEVYETAQVVYKFVKPHAMEAWVKTEPHREQAIEYAKKRLEEELAKQDEKNSEKDTKDQPERKTLAVVCRSE